MVKRVRVGLFGFQKRSVLVDADATDGAIVGDNLRWPDGTVVDPANIDNRVLPDDDGSDPSQPSVTLWSLILGIPAIIKSLAALVAPGYIYHDGANGLAAHEHPLHDTVVEAGETLTITDGKQYIVFEEIFADGDIVVEGTGELIVFNEPQPEPIGPDLTYNGTSGKLERIDYDDTSYKLLSYNGTTGKLETVDYIRDGLTLRKSLFYDGGGKLDYVDENYV